jgi:hypothetical protein
MGNAEFKFSGAEKIDIIRDLDVAREIRQGTKIATLILASDTPDIRKVVVDVKSSVTLMFQKSLVKPRPPGKIALVDKTLDTISDVCTEIVTEARKHL